MALTDENGGGIPATMLVSPTGGMNNGSGFGDWGGSGFWIILLFILLGNNGWGGFGGGFGGAGELYPWMNNSQNINNGFRDQMLSFVTASLARLPRLLALRTLLRSRCTRIRSLIWNALTLRRLRPLLA